MFDGEVELSNGADTKVVGSGQQGIAVPGQPIQVRPVLEARNIVQWWIYYPGILDPAELALTFAEETQAAASLAAYRSGDLQSALKQFPGYPAPPDPPTDAQRIYLAGLFLAIGAVDRAEAQLAKANSNAPLARALRLMIAAVTPLPNHPSTIINLQSSIPTASELIALSYAHQSTNNLRTALAVATEAVTRSTNFGFGWARVAELEFSFGRTRAAHEAARRALELTPKNAQAHSLNGFLLAAAYRFNEALAAFDRSIEIDPALGNAWLGRGLCKRRVGYSLFSIGDSDEWQRNLQTAAIVEPRRSLVRSYAGKAFGDAGDGRLALKELAYAAQLDPNDPTQPLYRALELYQENRPNEAVRDLERSISLNDNRAVYRSRLLLDQDEAVRRASLAKIYQSAGLDEVALREAARSVSYDYASHSAHQFLAESYNARRDPTRFNLRYETVWFNELLLANLLSPVGAGLLSQNISQQEYASLFEHNRSGILSSTAVRSDGQFREIASHYGLLDRFAYTLDLDYQHNNGTRPNNELDRLEWYGQFKYQVTARDSLFLLTKYQDYESGDNFQHYDPTNVSRKLRIEETQTPIVLAAAHREWSPGIHTTLLAGRLESDAAARDTTAVLDLSTNNPPPGVNGVRLQLFDDLRIESGFTAYMGEVNQVWQTKRHITIAGARLYTGSFDTHSVINDTNSSRIAYYGTPVQSGFDEPFLRWSLYAYHTWELWPRFRLTAGLAYERVDFPENFRFSPLSESEESRDQLSPKTALTWTIHPQVTFRAMYAQSLGGLSFDESVRLEPTQLAGFSQAFRSLISEAEAGSVVAPRHETAGAALDVKLSRSTFLGVEAQWIDSDVDQTIGVFKSTGGLPPPAQATASTTRERLRYDEQALRVSLDQLLGNEWSVGIGYQLEHSRLDWIYPEIPRTLSPSPSRTEEALLHQITARAQFQHPAGFFARSEVRWFIQDNDGYQPQRPGDSSYQLDLFAGWRFWRRRAEITLGCLNATDQNYRLNSLTPLPDQPRERVWMGRLRLEF
jgi:tetratricopeptide (TPR) repeat protein